MTTFNTGLIFMMVLCLGIILTILCCLITNGSARKEFKKYGYIERQRINFLKSKMGDDISIKW